MTTIRLRRGTSAEWAAVNPVLQAGEPAFETTTGTHKIGDGITPWADLESFLPESALAATIARNAFAAQHKGLIEKLRTNQPVKFLIHSASILSGYGVSSTTEGAYQSDANGTGRRIVAALASRYENTNITVINAGVAGASTRVVMDGGKVNGHIGSIAAWLAQAAPDVVLMNLNSNDATVAQTPDPEYELNWRRIIRDVRRFGSDLLIVPPFEHYLPSTQSGLFKIHKAAARRSLALEGVQPLAVQHALEDPAKPLHPLPGTTVDGTHPNVEGARMIAAAAAAYFPASKDLPSVPAHTIGRVPSGTWTDPLQRGWHAEWITVDGATRRATRQPTSDADGWDVLAPPEVPARVRLRGSLACYDMVQGSSGDVLPDKSGSGNDATLTGTYTWATGGGLTFSGDGIATLPLDIGNRLKFTPGRHWFSIRVVLKHATADSTHTIIGRRGDATSAPFGFSTDGGAYSIFERGSTLSMGQIASATTYEDWLISFALWDDRVRYFRNGAFIGESTMPGGVSLVPGDPAWPWTLGGRWSGAAMPGKPTPQLAATVQWVDLAQSYVSPATTEAATLHDNLKAYLAERSLPWGA